MNKQHVIYLYSERGVTLVELLVGMAIGLLVIAIAGGALMASRGISGTVSDAADIQQQAAYAIRVIGGQVRQAGSLYLNPDPANTEIKDSVFNQTEFETDTRNNPDGNDFKQDEVLDGSDTSISVSSRRYKEAVYISDDSISMSRNCIGYPNDDSADRKLESIFTFENNELKCSGNSGSQPIIRNVRDFQVRYLVQSGGASGNPGVYYVGAGDVNRWEDVQGVEVCLVLYGNERIDPAGKTYTGCNNEEQTYTDNVMHLLFRNVFQLRSQGLIRG